jgi:hypothetical protein
LETRWKLCFAWKQLVNNIFHNRSHSKAHYCHHKSHSKQQTQYYTTDSTKHRFQRVSYWKLVGNCVLLGSSWSTTYSTTEAIAKSITAITRATANSKRNNTQQIPQNTVSNEFPIGNLLETVLCMEAHCCQHKSHSKQQTQYYTTDSTKHRFQRVSYWKLVGNCVLLGSSWSTTCTTTEAIAKRITAIARATANSKRNITQQIPQNTVSNEFPIGNSLETVFCLEAVGQQHASQQKP